MTTSIEAGALRPAAKPLGAKPRDILKTSAKTWFVVATAGHWLFLAYIVGFYMPLLISGGAPALETTHLPNGYIPGDTVGNAAMVAHLVLAIAIIGGGPLQIMPQIRDRFPAFHRINGRVYMTAVVVSVLGGLYMTWTRDPIIGGLLGQIGTSTSGVLAMIFAGVALYHSVNRRIQVHSEWAFRMFLAASSVWFLRVGLMFWAVVSGGKAMMTAFQFLYFGQFLVPLAVYELYRHMRKNGSDTGKRRTALFILLLTGVMGVGIIGASLFMWLPRFSE